MRMTMAAAAALSTLATASVHGADTPMRTNPVPYFVVIEPMEAPIMSPARIEGRLQLSLILEARDGEVASALEKEMPRLRAASLSTILEYGRLHETGFRAVDVAALKGAVTAALKARYPGVQRVLVVKAAAMPAV